jgi:CDGSH-type Zn-finger protein
MRDSKPRIRFAADGPLIVEGLETLRDKSDEMPCQPKMALCRRGGSNNKPFCDGTHWNVEFDEASG